MAESDKPPQDFEFGPSHPPTVLGTQGSSGLWWKLILVVALVLSAGGGYLYVNPKLAAEWLEHTPFAPAPSVTTVYKWQDAEGNWQITDRPPAGVEYQTLQYRSDTNVMPLAPADDE